jgi:hypothetical protein
LREQGVERGDFGVQVGQVGGGKRAGGGERGKVRRARVENVGKPLFFEALTPPGGLQWAKRDSQCPPGR